MRSQERPPGRQRVTGGGGGIGKAAARRLLADEARVALSGSRLEVLQRAQAEIDPTGENTLIYAGHITTGDQARTLVDRVVDRFGGVDVLVNSTGIFRPVPFTDQTEEHLEEALGSILRPTFWVSQAVVEPMRKRGGGAIVNVGSMWALDAIATTPTSAYSMAQAGRHSLTKTLQLSSRRSVSGSTPSPSPSSRHRRTSASSRRRRRVPFSTRSTRSTHWAAIANPPTSWRR